jgi:hypothetical protein
MSTQRANLRADPVKKKPYRMDFRLKSPLAQVLHVRAAIKSIASRFPALRFLGATWRGRAATGFLAFGRSPRYFQPERFSHAAGAVG